MIKVISKGLLIIGALTCCIHLHAQTRPSLKELAKKVSELGNEVSVLAEKNDQHSEKIETLQFKNEALETQLEVLETLVEYGANKKWFKRTQIGTGQFYNNTDSDITLSVSFQSSGRYGMVRRLYIRHPDSNKFEMIAASTIDKYSAYGQLFGIIPPKHEYKITECCTGISMWYEYRTH